MDWEMAGCRDHGDVSKGLMDVLPPRTQARSFEIPSSTPLQTGSDLVKYVLPLLLQGKNENSGRTSVETNYNTEFCGCLAVVIFPLLVDSPLASSWHRISLPSRSLGTKREPEGWSRLWDGSESPCALDFAVSSSTIEMDRKL